MRKILIICRGAGDLATGIIHRLHRAGFNVLALETEHPAAIRRQVSFCEAVYEGTACIEGVTARRIDELSQMQQVFDAGEIPLMVDPAGESIAQLHPDIVIDAIIAKKNLGTTIDMAPLVIGVGPGFTAGEDVHLVVESMRGHNLARIIDHGSALPNTGTPGNIGGYTSERVIHAPAAGYIHNIRAIGDVVEQGEEIARIYENISDKYIIGKECMQQADCVDTVCHRQSDDRKCIYNTHTDTYTDANTSVYATIPGIIRGLIREGYHFSKGFKIADIDPRKSELSNCFTISDKARSIGGSVLEAVCAYATGVRRGESVHLANVHKLRA